MLWAHFYSQRHNRRGAHLASKHYSRVYILCNGISALFMTCTYANWSWKNVHHRIFRLQHHTTNGDSSWIPNPAQINHPFLLPTPTSIILFPFTKPPVNPHLPPSTWIHSCIRSGWLQCTAQVALQGQPSIRSQNLPHRAKGMDTAAIFYFLFDHLPSK